MADTASNIRPSSRPLAYIDIDRYFERELIRVSPYAGQTQAEFQDALRDFHRNIQPSECEFYHTIELADGRCYPGEWDLRGVESEYLGNLDVGGKHVIEYGPASGWLSAHIARRAASLTTLDLPYGVAVDIMPFPGLDQDECRRSGIRSFAKLRNSWWFARRELAFDATAVYADIYDPPADLGTFDVAVFGAILLHLSHPFRALQRAAERTRKTIVVTDVIGPQEGVHLQIPGFDPGLALLVFGPTAPPNGVVHWWALSSQAVVHMLRRLGFTQTTVTRHSTMPLFTVVAHRPD